MQRDALGLKFYELSTYVFLHPFPNSHWNYSRGFFFKALIRKYKESMKQDNSGKKEKIINYKI